MSTPYTFRCFERFTELPESYQPLVTIMKAMGFFHGQTWLEFQMTFQWEESELQLYGVEDGTGRPLLLVPLRSTIYDGAVPLARTLATIGHSENFSELSVVFDSTLGDIERGTVLSALFSHFRTMPLSAEVLRLWPAQSDGRLATAVNSALRQAGFWVQPYANSFNWYEDTTGKGWQDYLADRSQNHRHNIRRRSRDLEKSGNLELYLYNSDNTAEELQQGIDDYIIATVESWKSPSSLVSRGMLALMRMTGRERCLRIGILKYEGRPIAGQFWIVSAGVAHAMRISHNEDYKQLSPGVVLTAHVLEHLLDQDKVNLIDFGLGDDDYKKKWVRSRRDYDGFMAFNPSTPRGVLFGVQHIFGKLLKPAVRAILKPFRRG